MSLAYKTSWISSLVHQTVNNCDKNKHQKELKRIKHVIAWTRLSKSTRNTIIKNKLKNLNVNNIKNTTYKDFDTKWIKIPCLGDKGDQLLKLLKTKIETPFY